MTTQDGDPMTVLARRDDTTCRVRDVLDRVGSKWALTVIHELGPGKRRFTQIKNSVPGISQRMLTETLRGLERDGLVERTVHPVVPPRVDYELTPLGQTLLETVRSLLDWALDHIDDIDAAREAYDARS
jgi:DNA-binding HxlR family transcriptional regulator